MSKKRPYPLTPLGIQDRLKDPKYQEELDLYAAANELDFDFFRIHYACSRTYDQVRPRHRDEHLIMEQDYEVFFETFDGVFMSATVDDVGAAEMHYAEAGDQHDRGWQVFIFEPTILVNRNAKLMTHYSSGGLFDMAYTMFYPIYIFCEKHRMRYFKRVNNMTYGS